MKKTEKKLHNCEYCGKLTTNNMFCSKSCSSRKNGRNWGIKGNITNRKNKTGIYGLTKKQRILICKKAAEVNRKNKTGFFNSNTQNENGKKVKLETQIKAGKLGGIASVKSIINNSPYIFNNIHFSNKSEMEIGINIHYQIEFLVEGKNYQFKVGNKLYDFYIKKLKLFIEYHPWDLKFTEEEYYNRRRENLNENGYKDYNLVVIK